MRIFVTILFVTLCFLAAKNREQNRPNSNDKVNIAFIVNSPEQNHPVLEKNVYIDQDSNETNDFLLFYVEIEESPKPACRKIRPNALLVHSFHQSHLSNLLTDLPPPANSLLV